MKPPIYLFILLVAVTACRQKAGIPENFDYGKVENNVYRNEYFRFELPIPSTWAVQNKEEMNRIRQEGQKVIEKNSDKKFAARIKASEINSAMLLTVFKNKVDSFIGEFNPSVSVLAENTAVSGIRSGSDYLEHVQKLMKESAMSFDFSGLRKQRIGNREFDVMTVIVSTHGKEVKQLYSAVVDRGFALGIIISYINGEQEQELKDILKGLHFR